MTTTETAPTAVASGYRGPVTDACAFHEWSTPEDLADYFDLGWRQAIMRPGDRGGPIGVKAKWLYVDPQGEHRLDAYPATGVPGSDPALTVRQLVEENDCGRVVLGYKEGILATGINNYLLARVVTRAANRWTIERWFDRDPRFHGMVLVTSAVPETAAADIREFGAHPRMVGVALGANGLGRGFGHAVHHPIHEAAAELGLPLVLQAGSDAVSSLDATPTAGGLPATYAQYATHAPHAMMGHVASLIMQGVFERFPSLRVLCVGGGAMWLPAYAWRLDYWFKTNFREAPWLTRLPSEYLADHLRLATHSLEAPADTARLAAALRTWPGIERQLVYASAYPERTSESPTSISRRLPSEWHAAVFHDNASELFRFPDDTASGGATGELAASEGRS